MSSAKRFALRSIFVAAASVAIMGQAYGAVSCHKINAKGVGQDLGGGSTVARIIGGGLLQGSTTASFGITGGAPPVFTIDGTIMFATKQGATLTANLVGTFNIESGVFLSTGPVTAATGKLFGATGTLTLDGVQDLSNGQFSEDVSGMICVDLNR